MSVYESVKGARDTFKDDVEDWNTTKEKRERRKVRLPVMRMRMRVREALRW